MSQLPLFKPNAVVSCGAYDENLGIIRDTLKANPNVAESRIILTKEYVHTDETQVIDAFKPIDHLAQFKKYVLENIGSDTTTITELEEILK